MAVAVGKTVIVKTHAGLRARTRPNGPVKKKNGRNVLRPYGFKFKVLEIKSAGGRQWARAASLWYAVDYLGEYKKPTTSARVRSPVPGYGVNYPYGVRNSRYKAGFHTGEDRAAPIGTRVVAVRDGKIIRADSGGAYGKWTHLKADNGHVYVYCHLSSRTVKVGQRVKKGQTIGRVGATGNVTGPHLHFEMSRGSTWRYGNVQKPTW
jgi:murein DD-endopeptidase MepM/ murein hydrolase activator NlpD